MRPLDDQKKFQAGGSEDESRPGPSSRESPDEEMEGEPSEEELAAEVEEFNRAEAVPEFADDEEGEKIPDLSRPRWMARIVSCLIGTSLGAAIAGLLVNSVPASRQPRMFLIYFLVLAPLFSFSWHWFFVLRPQRLAKKMDEESTNHIGSEPIHPK